MMFLSVTVSFAILTYIYISTVLDKNLAEFYRHVDQGFHSGVVAALVKPVSGNQIISAIIFALHRIKSNDIKNV
jgi:hypothetical protein